METWMRLRTRCTEPWRCWEKGGLDGKRFSTVGLRGVLLLCCISDVEEVVNAFQL
jgi:hypothetical protein